MAGDSSSTHYFGGENRRAGAICPVCKIPLLCLADLDCVSLRDKENGKLFSELDRLPLYYCWKCCAEKLSYQIRGDRVKVFRNEGKPRGDDFPYANFPAEFERRTVRLLPIPYETAKLLAVAQEIDEYWLTEQDKQELQVKLEHLRHAFFSKNYFNRHQVGGLLGLIQGHEHIECPNPECKNHPAANRFSAPRMKELAVLQNDPHSGLPMIETLEELSAPSSFNEFIQVVYWVCEECLTIAASNRCD